MFGGPPPAPSQAELKAQEEAASNELKFALSTCFALYLSPFVIDYVRKLV
ncbi:hypothetical protein EJ05DRAFT_502926 [Pseudovirgaria hyperparasitica]|uniref:Mitochondrial outer membrane translocase complex, subunit Tom5 n=1 Tax=Pseudovirgaria hyperparasitica TaxID=470096 RepID=A0A6A6W1L7_9PEZI|nr:uncharacterized protein EJ05DRAFT_502926 [Pseudovirgaria hyperparasitica]KAF2755467.1 hypothetical protein EJ05DRAFT_502926 [Pseudovirgaria hyperparasitica]